MGTPAPAPVADLGAMTLGPVLWPYRFSRDRKAFLSSDYKEEQLRAEFLNPFFTALGWDMDSKQGLSETFKQVIHEESINACPEHSRRGREASSDERVSHLLARPPSAVSREP